MIVALEEMLEFDEFITNWCNQYGGTTCGRAGKGAKPPSSRMAKPAAKPAARAAAKKPGKEAPAKVKAAERRERVAEKKEKMKEEKGASKPVAPSKKFSPKLFPDADKVYDLRKEANDVIDRGRAAGEDMKTVMDRHGKIADQADKSFRKAGGAMNSHAKKHEKVWKSMTDPERETVTQYSKAGHQAINEGLREGRKPGQVGLLDKALSKAKLPTDMVVYRGVPPEGKYFGADPGKMVGKVIKDKAYISTTMMKGATLDFGNDIMEIRLPKGHGGLMMNAMGKHSHQDEHEVLLPRDTKLKIVSAKKGEHGWHLIAEPVKPRVKRK